LINKYNKKNTTKSLDNCLIKNLTD